MSITTTQRTPKRQVQRRVSRIVANNQANTIGLNTVRTVTEKQTLIRTKITGEIVYSGVATASRMALMLDIWRNGNQVADAINTSEILDMAETLEVIVRDNFIAELSTDVGIKVPSRVDIDTKTQRKLNPADIIVLTLVTSSSTGQFDIYLTITQWFKLA